MIGRQIGGGGVPVEVGPGLVGVDVGVVVVVDVGLLVDVGGLVVTGEVARVEVALGVPGVVEVGRAVVVVGTGAGEVRAGRVVTGAGSGGGTDDAGVGALVEIGCVVVEPVEVGEWVCEDVRDDVCDRVDGLLLGALSGLTEVTAGDDTDLLTLCVAAAGLAPGPLWARAYAEQVPATVTAAAVPMVASLRVCPPWRIHFSQATPPAACVACPAAVAQAMPGPRARTAGSRMPPRSRSTTTRSASRRSHAGQSSTCRWTSGAEAAPAPGSNSTRRGT